MLWLKEFFMKIEKKKVTGNSRLSNASKAGVASMLSMSAILMSGCTGDAESGQVIGPVEPDNNNPNSSGLSALLNQTTTIQTAATPPKAPKYNQVLL